eukprot:m.108300 g.108300  ORF g.108300 m.108300 type:complete len:82 (+) comp9187_c2_seq1:475-720(+)
MINNADTNYYILIQFERKGSAIITLSVGVFVQTIITIKFYSLTGKHKVVVVAAAAVVVAAAVDLVVVVVVIDHITSSSLSC